MKSLTSHITIVCVLLFLASCGLKPITTLKDGTEGDRLFTRAEKKFEQGEYEQALKYYFDYIDDYPEQALAPAALLKIGAIYAAGGHYDKARQAYQDLVVTYPDSPYALDGMVDNLVTYYKEGRYSDVIKKSYDVPEDRAPSDYLIRKYAIMGDAFLALSAPGDAMDAYMEAYRRSEPPENSGILHKMRKALESVPNEELPALSEATQSSDIKGYIEYQKCLNIMKEGKKDDALAALTAFILNFDKHPAAQEAEEIKSELTASLFTINLVGCLMPTSGKYESYGTRAQRGFDLAYGLFSQAHDDMDLRVVYRDTESDPEKTVQAVRELAELGVCAIVGPVGTVEEAAREAQIRGIPIMTLTGKEDITLMGDFVFRNFLTREMQVKSVVSYSFEVLGLNNFAILYPEEQYGIDMMNLFWDEVDAFGGEIVGVESYTTETTDFANAIKKMIGLYYPIPVEPDVIVDENGQEQYVDAKTKETDPEAPVKDFDALFIPDAAEKVGLILPQLSFYDVGDVYLLGTNLWHTDKLIQMAGPYVSGTIIPESFFAESRKTNVQQFVNTYNAAFGEEPGFIEAIGYDSAMMIFHVIGQHPESYSQFRDRLLVLKDFKGITGITSVGETGDVWKALYLLNANERGFRELPQ